jgi:hypothetical protein
MQNYWNYWQPWGWRFLRAVFTNWHLGAEGSSQPPEPSIVIYQNVIYRKTVQSTSLGSSLVFHRQYPFSARLWNHRIERFCSCGDRLWQTWEDYNHSRISAEPRAATLPKFDCAKCVRPTSLLPSQSAGAKEGYTVWTLAFHCNTSERLDSSFDTAQYPISVADTAYCVLLAVQ